MRRLAYLFAAPVLAILFSMLVTSVLLLATGNRPLAVFQSMIDYGSQPSSVVAVINRSTTYYLSALAVAIGFRMNLFNIGVDGQYRLAAICAAGVGAAVSLPAPLHVALIVLTAMCVGAAWAGIAGILKVTRGVSEVISTIMLNFVATGLVAWLLTPDRLAVQIEGSNNIATETLPASARVPGITVEGGVVYGFVIVAVLAGIGYWVLVGKTRFGFDLRATGTSEQAAVASGVKVKRMIMSTMLLSGAVAGLVGMPQLLGASYAYGLDFPTGYGFNGIAIALLGRNHPIGMALGALLWAFLERSAQILDLEGVPKEIVTIMQGTIVLAVVIAYEIVRRYAAAREQKQVAVSLGGPDGAAGTPAPAAVPA